MKLAVYIASAAIAVTLPLFSILPPAWQDVAELKAILEDRHIDEYLQSGDVILQIAKSDHGWTIVTNHSKFYADVVPLPQKMIGPEKFEIRFRHSPASPE